mgnify:CR=1 FL=1
MEYYQSHGTIPQYSCQIWSAIYSFDQAINVEFNFKVLKSSIICTLLFNDKIPSQLVHSSFFFNQIFNDKSASWGGFEV